MPRGIPNDPAAAAAKRDAMVQRNRRVDPVTTNTFRDAEDHQIGQDQPRTLRSDGPAARALDSAHIQVVDRPVDQEKLAMLAFMEEPVTVHIHTTTDKTAEQVFEIFNNGQREVFRRGETKTVKRKFVNELATRKLTTFENQRKRDAEGVQHEVYRPTTALRYPFSVVNDPHPRGADWLKATLAMA